MFIKLKKEQVSCAVNVGSEKALYAPVIYKRGNGERVYDVCISNLVEIPILNNKVQVYTDNDHIPMNRCWFRFEDWINDLNKFLDDRFANVEKYFKNNKPMANGAEDYRPGFHVMYGYSAGGKMSMGDILVMNCGRIDALRTMPGYEPYCGSLAVVINDKPFVYNNKKIESKVYPYLVWKEAFDEARKALVEDEKDRWEHANKVFDKATESWAQGNPISLDAASDKVKREEKEQIDGLFKTQVGSSGK